MSDTRVKISSIVQSQLPDFVQEEYPLVSEFLKEYYNSLEREGGELDILQNIDKYVKLDNLVNSLFGRVVAESPRFPKSSFVVDGGFSRENLVVYKNGIRLVENVDYVTIGANTVNLGQSSTVGDVLEFYITSPSSTYLTSDVSFVDDTINVFSTYGFPQSNGLIRINSEIILYKEKTDTSFIGCTRGFSGVTGYSTENNADQLVFSSSNISEHRSKSLVENLSFVLLKEFLFKLKKQLIPGFENKDFVNGLNESLFIKQAKDFYKSKGTDDSYKILFKVLYGENVSVLRPRDYLLRPSDAQYKITKDLVVESISGNPESLLNKTLYQDAIIQADIGRAYGTVTNVEKIQRSDKTYYILSLDNDYNKDLNVSGTVYGDFSIHPTTKTTSSVEINSTIIDVDSTIGFPSFGEITYTVDGREYTTNYSIQSVTQFLIISRNAVKIPEGTDIKFNAFAYSTIGQDVVKVRVTGVISDVSFDSDNYLMSKGDNLKVSTLGFISDNIYANSWIFNIANKFKVQKINGPNSFNSSLNLFSYEVITFDPHTFYLADAIELIASNGTITTYKVVKVNNENSISIEGPPVTDLNLKYTAKRKISKPKFVNFTDLNKYSANVQNSYVRSANDIYVTSNSLPNYLNEDILIKDTKNIVFSGTFSGEILDLSSGNPSNIHGLYTGDVINYLPFSGTSNLPSPTNLPTSLQVNNLGIPYKEYYVERVDETKIRLANSRVDLYKKNYISISSATVTNQTFSRVKNQINTLLPQSIIKNITNPRPANNNQYVETPVGQVGIFVNGVEAFSYKSSDKIYYGGIERVEVNDGGNNYDIINPPSVEIFDDAGSNAELYAHVEGNLIKIDVIDGGFDYIGEPNVTITGGNGSGAVAKPIMSSFRHKVSFNSESFANAVNLSTDIIGFSTYHKFRDNEKVIYLTNGGTAVGGLSANAQYYVNVQDAYNVKLHKTLNDSISGINTINLTSYGNGIHELESLSTKKNISGFSIINSGSGYSNKKTSCTNSGINTAANTINIINHGYKTGEIVKYTSTGSPIGNLTNNETYYIIKVNDDNFKLTKVGIGTDNKDFYFKTGQVINLTSIGSSDHIFNYPDISVSIEGTIGISTLVGQNFGAKIQPIFRGSIKNIFVKNSGVGYGSSEIINYNRQPKIVLGIGSQAQLSPIISNGKVSQVLVLNGGNNYTSPPDIEVLGAGFGAELTPIINNGKIVEVKIVNGGVGFNTNGTAINVVPAGDKFNFYCKIKQWTINKVEKELNSGNIFDDDGIIDRSQFTNNGLQYCHLYAPRKLRRSVFGVDFVNGKKVFLQDLNIVGNTEVKSSVHSPIIGWAYDGNPIYGPYGYSSPTGGSVREMVSGYKQQFSSDRPNPISESGKKIFPDGFFVEDYKFNNSGDLDEHNGRFCITPEFPNGVYAYFATINNGTVESSGAFKNYKKPTFPYLIGNTFKSIPNGINYSSDFSSQNSFPFRSFNLLRNTKPYNLNTNNSEYDFIFNPLKVREPLVTVKSVTSSELSDINVISGGNNYKVGDRVIFNNENTEGSDAYARVTYLKGKKVNSISFASTSYENVELYPSSSSETFIGFTSIPHTLVNNDIIVISGLSTSLKDFNGVSAKVGVRSDTLSLSESVGDSATTGIITYFKVNGFLGFPNIRENDIYTIDNEKVKVLSIDKLSSRIKVLREYDSSVGTSHSITTVLYENTRKFTFKADRNISINFDLNREIYFNPKESVSLGSSSGVGIGSTLYFSNPGVGITNIFVPTKTIYIPNHKLETGTELIYSSNGGAPLFVSEDGVSNFQLTDNQILYASKVSTDLIGISTVKVGLGSTGSFVGIDSSISSSTLFFTNIGLGENHSFKTNKTNILTAEVYKNNVRVSTAETHGLKIDDLVYIDALPGVTTTFVVKYNDQNKRLVINPVSFESPDVDILNNTIFIKNHGYSTGEKIIYNSTIEIGGLSNDGIYYIVRVSQNKIKLSSSYYNSIKDVPEVIDFTSASSGTISLVNPRIIAISNNIIKFDLSDSSLSYKKGSISYPAFDFVFFKNSNFTEEFYKSDDSTKFDVIKTGRIGIDPSASVTLLTENLDIDLFYGLVPIDLEDNFSSKKDIIFDSENVNSNNKILLTQSIYFGFKSITSVGQTSFDFNILDYPEKEYYSSTDGTFTYYTDSTNTSGEIQQVELAYGGRYYDTSPGITSVFSKNGTDSILEPVVYSIGKVNRLEIEDIGFDYPIDPTLYPTAKLPQILKVNPLSTFKTIGVSSVGIDYSISPNLVVIDSFTNEVVRDVDLRYDINLKQVEIIKNTDGIYNKKPLIIPTNNSNGIPISNITFNSVSKDVTIELGIQYSFGQIFPFNVGDKVLVENTSVGIANTLKGYNSKEYGYALFELSSVNPQYGGAGANITYNLTDYLKDSDVVGTFDLENSAGIVVPEKYFPTFDPVLEKYSFSIGETVKSDSSTGTVISWNKNTEELKISSKDKFEVNSEILGKSSKARGNIVEVEDFDAVYTVNSSSIVKKGWNSETGFLNNEFQVIIDSDYYQDFSYSLKSKIDYDTWNSEIGNINHTVGFKKFGDLALESQDFTFSGIQTSQNDGNFSGLAEFVSEIDLNCVNDFDMAREKTVAIDSEYFSKEIILNSVSIQDEFISVGNRVLSIDDISPEFSNVPSEQIYSNVDSFRLSDYRTKKYITYVRDKKFTNSRQVAIVTLLHDGLEGYLNQYATIESDKYLGSFDFGIFGDEGTLRFYPNNYFYNDYDINVLSYSINDNFSGVGSTSIGNLVDLRSSTATVSVGTTTQTNIVSIGASYVSSKILVQFTSSDGKYYQFDELTLLNDGSNVSILDYGRLNNSRSSYIGDGIGTYSAYISGSNINLDFTPNVGLGTTFVVNTLRVSIASTNTGITTSSLKFDTSEIKTEYVSISSSPSPTQVAISTYSVDYESSYYIVTVEDVTNGEYQISELITVNDDTNSFITEFGVIETSSGLGTFGIDFNDSVGTTLGFTPNPNISVNVKVYQNSVGIIDPFYDFNSVGFTNASIDSDYSGFSGIFNSIKRSFDLYHQQRPIFQRIFDASDTSVVNIANNSLRIPNHFYVTGEEISYSDGGGDPIGIATTTISGIGLTDKLPSSLYAIKINELDIRLASSSENALKAIPEPLIISNVGVGSEHVFTAKKQNAKCLVTIDNYIQSPIVSTALTTSLVKFTPFNSINITVAGINSIFSGDLLKIDDEIIRVNSVGFGSTNVLLVDRAWMGTNAKNHLLGSTVTKILGNYNIVDNTIHFVEAPYGNSPIGTVTNSPDERDYTGITTRSSFSGRVFLRSGVEDSSTDPYDKNYIFDSLSEQFNGIDKDFVLKSSNADVSGLSTGGSIILINNIFQEPQRTGGVINIEGNYTLSENVGITTIEFTGGITSSAYDINTSSIPRGGVIVSVASTQGFGYQPLISAGGTSIVSTGGTISSISVGYSGSGYRCSEKYEILTKTSSTISAGSTLIYIDSENGVFEKLSYSSSNTIGIGSILQDVPIVGVGNTYLLIGLGSTSSQEISSNQSVLVSLNSPNTGLVNVGVRTASNGVVNYQFIGFATITSGNISTNVNITNPGSGFTSTNPPIVIFDSPNNYYNIPLIYSDSSSVGIGTEATVDIIVGQGSSVIDFEIKNLGYGYKPSEVLTVPTGGLTGIPTDSSKPFASFELTIDETFSDLFYGWSVGDFQVIDKIENLFNGVRRNFPIKINGAQTSIRSRVGSNIDIQSVLLIFINDILQTPGIAYNFDGGSTFTFSEAPKEGDTCKIIFYKGTGPIDVIFNDILESIKLGDTVRLNSDIFLQKENERIVTDIIASDIIQTNPYAGEGIVFDELLSRPLIWCRQTEDKIIAGQEIGKNREIYEPNIQPSTNIIQNIGAGSTEIFVQSVKIFFDDIRENAENSYISKIVITSQDNLVGAYATAIVSAAGTISSIDLIDGGLGFDTTPIVVIGNPIGVGSTAEVVASITSGIVTSLTLTNPGSGYTQSNPPQVLFEYPKISSEKIENVSYEGDFGIVVGVSTTTVGVASTGIVFDFFVPTDSYLRNTQINVGISTTGISGIQTGYYFTIFNSNIGNGVTSLDALNSIVGIGTTCLDNVYQVASVSIAQTSVPGVGLTDVTRVTTSIIDYNGLSGIGYSNFYGEFSWGKINSLSRKNPLSFITYNTNGIAGLSSGPIIQRVNPLLYVGYSTTT